MVLMRDQEVWDRVHRSAALRREDGLVTLTFLAMGTRCRVLFEPSGDGGKAFAGTLLDRVADFEAKYSRFLDNSLVSAINHAAGKYWVELDEEADRLFKLCEQFVFFSRGTFDPTALPLIQLWDWRKGVVPDAAAVAGAMALVGWHKVQRKPGGIYLPQPGMCLDLGGIGKEYAVDMVVSMASEHGIRNVLVDFGQDIRVQGNPPGRPAWHVGLENPRQPGSCWASVGVTDHAVASSGDYLRHFMREGCRFGHIIDPRTGYPVSNSILVVSVVASTCTIAGILTTAAFVLGPKDSLDLINNFHGAAGVILTETSTLITPRFHEYLVQQN